MKNSKNQQIQQNKKNASTFLKRFLYKFDLSILLKTNFYYFN
jgi:hypothetical protein